jgi:flagellar export protein FliJ
MSAFYFRLDRLLRLRAQSERSQAGELAHAARHQDEQRDALGQANSQFDRASRQLAALPGTVRTAGTLQQLGLTVSAVGEVVEQATAALREADARLESERALFQRARQDRRAVERLRELRHATWHTATVREEQKQFDEIAAVRHARRSEP